MWVKIAATIGGLAWKYWKPVSAFFGSLMLVLRLRHLKKKTRVQADEIADLRVKEEIHDKHERIEKMAETVRDSMSPPSSPDDFNRMWDEDETQG